MVMKRRLAAAAIPVFLLAFPAISAAGPSSVAVEPTADTVRLPILPRGAGDKDVKPNPEPPRIDLKAKAPAGAPSPSTRYLFSDGFEGDFPGSWTVFDNDGATGGSTGGAVWDDTRSEAYAGTWSAGGADGWMVQGPFDLSEANSALVSFRYRTERSGRFKVLASVDGVDFHGFQVSGDSGGWRYGELDLGKVPALGSLAGQPRVWIAFAATAGGVHLDEVTVQAAVGAVADIRIDPLTLAFSADPKTQIYVEIDWMEDGTHSHKPSPAVIERIRQTFAAAGYKINIDVSEAIPHQAVLNVLSSPSGSPDVQAIRNQYFDHIGDNHYFYSIWAHNYSRNGVFTSSGGVGDLPGRIHLSTLGSFSNQVGSFSNQVATFIHEFGHNLEQRHGGLDNQHYKPNYLSIMNYHFALDGIGPILLLRGFANTASGFDDFSYSHGVMPDLNETNLNEAFGIGLGKAVDWNCSGTITSGVIKDIQDSNPCWGVETREVLSDWDNWTYLESRIRTFSSPLAETPSSPSEDCLTREEHAATGEELARLRRLGLLPPDAPGPPPAEALEGLSVRTFAVHNDGGEPLNVTAMALDVATPWIEWEPQAPFTVQPGGSQTVYVFADYSLAPLGTTNRRLLVQSNDADESPYPGGVNLSVTTYPPPVCYPLVLSHTGSGGDPVATPPATPGCPADQFSAGYLVSLKASPIVGWKVSTWSGTDADEGNATNTPLTMPAAAHAAAVNYVVIPDQPLQNNVTLADSMNADVPHIKWKLYYIDLTPGSTQLVVDVFGMTKDVDLYVRYGAKPEWAVGDCISNKFGLLPEKCTFAAPSSGRWWIGVKNYGTGTMNYNVRAAWNAPALAPLDFHSVAPCRAVDTRTSAPLASGVTQTFAISGTCGVPASARAVAVNVTVLGPAANGNVVLWPADQQKPATSAINFAAGDTRANNSIQTLATNGAGTLAAQSFLSNGSTVHLVVDVAGYFQ